MPNERFDVSQYPAFNAFRDEMIHICKNGNTKDLIVCLKNPQSSQFLWMREAPALLGSNLCKEMVFDGFAFYEPHSLLLIFQLLEISIAARSNKIFSHLWRLTGSRSQSQPQVDFLVYYFKNEDQQYVSEDEKEIVVEALNGLRTSLRAQLSAHNKVYNQPLFIELWARSQQNVLNAEMPSDKNTSVRKL